VITAGYCSIIEFGDCELGKAMAPEDVPPHVAALLASTAKAVAAPVAPSREAASTPVSVAARTPAQVLLGSRQTLGDAASNSCTPSVSGTERNVM
jgi:hypothetical protein